MQDENILVWLPSPMGDAILCTPALRALRQAFKNGKITFLANDVVRQILSGCRFCDSWLTLESNNPFKIAKQLRSNKFTYAILFKNSFASALAALLARIPSRIGYVREKRGFLLTEKLYPSRLADGEFEPKPMVDYYLAIASWLGADTSDKSLELAVEAQALEKLKIKLPEVAESKGPVVILVPGGAFGPSKCWPGERFAKTADWMIDNFNATVVVSVSPVVAEKKIADEICNLSKNNIINLAEKPLNLNELKALFSIADMVITNDTGPRHIGIALKRKIVTLFGPNDPVWTDTDYENEIQIVGQTECAPCRKPICEKDEHLCMEAITVEMVCQAAKKLLENNRNQRIFMNGKKFIKISESFFVDPDFKDALSEIGLNSIDDVFSFEGGTNLVKPELAKHRSRLKIEINSPETTLFLKRYNQPSPLTQIRNWLNHGIRRASMSSFDSIPAEDLKKAGINTPKTIAAGEQWGIFFEKRSFIITEKIPSAESLEQRLPDCFNRLPTNENLKQRKEFITQLARFVSKFHATKYRHKDLYLCHIFQNENGEFSLIDLARAFKPKLLGERFRIKDISQLYYSAPAKNFSKMDRLRFYLIYSGHSRLTKKDKIIISRIKKRAKRMGRHDIKHGRSIPFQS